MSAPEGITNHLASEEEAEDAKLQGPKPTPEAPAKEDTSSLPKGMAEKVETINVNTLHPNK